MGNDNKIKDIISSSSREYLANAYADDSSLIKYNLEKEYAGTKKNHSWFVYILSLTTIVFLVAVALFFSSIIAKKTAAQAVDISSFQELNLKDLLDIVKRAEDNYERLSREYIDIEQSMATELNLADTNYKSELDIINAGRNSQSEKARLVNTAGKKYQSNKAEIHLRYEALLAVKKSEQEAAAKALDSFDSRRLQEAKRNEELLASERKLFEEEKSRLTEFYEQRISKLSAESQKEKNHLLAAKDALIQTLEQSKEADMAEQFLLYNPIFTEQSILSILAAYSKRPDYPDSKLEEMVAQAGLEAGLELKEIKQSLSSIEAIADRLLEAPYKNSVPQALNAMNNAALSLAAIYQEIISNCVELIEIRNKTHKEDQKVLAAKTSELESTKKMLDSANNEKEFYINALESLSRKNGDSGYVLAVKDDGVYLWLDFLASGAKEAWVFRNEKVIARLALAAFGKLFKGTVIEKTEDQIQALDKIVVNMSAEAAGR